MEAAWYARTHARTHAGGDDVQAPQDQQQQGLQPSGSDAEAGEAGSGIINGGHQVGSRPPACMDEWHTLPGWIQYIRLLQHSLHSWHA
jgi:hypothetical protein